MRWTCWCGRICCCCCCCAHGRQHALLVTGHTGIDMAVVWARAERGEAAVQVRGDGDGRFPSRSRVGRAPDTEVSRASRGVGYAGAICGSASRVRAWRALREKRRCVDEAGSVLTWWSVLSRCGTTSDAARRRPRRRCVSPRLVAPIIVEETARSTPCRRRKQTQKTRGRKGKNRLLQKKEGAISVRIWQSPCRACRASAARVFCFLHFSPFFFCLQEPLSLAPSLSLFRLLCRVRRPHWDVFLWRRPRRSMPHHTRHHHQEVPARVCAVDPADGRLGALPFRRGDSKNRTNGSPKRATMRERRASLARRNAHTRPTSKRSRAHSVFFKKTIKGEKKEGCGICARPPGPTGFFELRSASPSALPLSWHPAPRVRKRDRDAGSVRLPPRGQGIRRRTLARRALFGASADSASSPPVARPL